MPTQNYLDLFGKHTLPPLLQVLEASRSIEAEKYIARPCLSGSPSLRILWFITKGHHKDTKTVIMLGRSIQGATRKLTRPEGSSLRNPDPFRNPMPKRPIPHLRWYIAGLLCLASELNYLDRQTLSVLADTIQRGLSLSTIQYSYITTSFLVSYTIMYAVSRRN